MLWTRKRSQRATTSTHTRSARHSGKAVRAAERLAPRAHDVRAAAGASRDSGISDAADQLSRTTNRMQAPRGPVSRRWLKRACAPFMVLLLGCSEAGRDDVNEEEPSAPRHSSLPQERLLAHLTAREVDILCSWTALSSPGGSRTCEDGSTRIEVGWTERNCQKWWSSLPEGCTAQVADHENCVRSSDCDPEMRREQCAAVAACAPLER